MSKIIRMLEKEIEGIEEYKQKESETQEKYTQDGDYVELLIDPIIVDLKQLIKKIEKELNK